VRHVMSREDLLDMVGEIPRPAIRRAILLGRVECLGLFFRAVEGDHRRAAALEASGQIDRAQHVRRAARAAEPLSPAVTAGVRERVLVEE